MPTSQIDQIADMQAETCFIAGNLVAQVGENLCIRNESCAEK
jgi:hypothetical protein